ncbi:MAG TPA: VWA domain-containing protein [Gaiellaceae bacterium]|nr:VWA domain-containing protein [Gaiellaceae bacterium]
MSFGQPLLLLTLLVLPLVVAAYLLAQRRRSRFAVAFTNLEVLAAVAARRRPWRRWVAAAVFLLSLAALCVAVARPKVSDLVPSQRAAVILVIDVSGSMNANDVKPTRLAAAEKAISIFLDHAPKQLRVGLIAFAGEADVITPATTDHDLVRLGAESLGNYGGYGGTAIGDALAAAVRLAQQAVGPTKPASSGTTIAYHPQGPQSPASILFLSDGAQHGGVLQPSQGAAIAKAAGIPVYSVSIGTPNGVLNRPYNGPGGFGGFSGGIPVPVDPTTLRQIAAATGGKFTQAENAKTLDASYANLGSRLGRKPGKSEITNELVLLAAGLLLGAGLLSVLWSPRLP